MVTVANDSTDPRHQVLPGMGYDGVVRISSAGSFGTGALLFDGRAVLTVAHLLRDTTEPPSVFFETSASLTPITSSQIEIHPDYDNEANNDLAVLWLSEPAPIEADRYDLHRSSNEVGETFQFVGYGQSGTGDSGAMSGAPNRLLAENRFDAGMSDLKDALGFRMAWTPERGTQLAADFDNGLIENDALGAFLSRHDVGLGANEGLIASGDSGGPAFLEGRIVGISSYITSLGRGNVEPDVDASTNSSFGEIAAWQRISHYQQWIDQTIRDFHVNAPETPEEVQLEVTEGDSGTHYAYFLLSFEGIRAYPDQVISVDYATRDGSAMAEEDYIATAGTLNLYPGEDHVAIAVEIVGNTTREEDEIFYLDVMNPVGGSFGAGVDQLTASRTILDDDFF